MDGVQDDGVRAYALGWSALLLRLGIGLLFFVRGAAALLSPAANELATRLGSTLGGDVQSGMVPTIVAIFAWVELFVGAMLLLGCLTRIFAACGVLLALLYAVCGQFAATARCPFGARGCERFFFDNFIERGSWILAVGGSLALLLLGASLLSVDGLLVRFPPLRRLCTLAIARGSLVALLLRLTIVAVLAMAFCWQVGLGAEPSAIPRSPGDPALLSGFRRSPSFSDWVFLVAAIALLIGYFWRTALGLGLWLVLISFVIPPTRGVSSPVQIWLALSLTVAGAFLVIGPGAFVVPAHFHPLQRLQERARRVLRP